MRGDINMDKDLNQLGLPPMALAESRGKFIYSSVCYLTRRTIFLRWDIHNQLSGNG